MNIEIVGGDRETTVFSVNGQEIEVPCETKIHDPKNVNDFTLCYWVVQAVDKKTRDPISEEIRSAIADDIVQGCTKEGVKFEVVTEQ